MSLKSYAYGARTHPLLRQTIGENLRNTVNRFGENEALICVHQNF